MLNSKSNIVVHLRADIPKIRLLQFTHCYKHHAQFMKTMYHGDGKLLYNIPCMVNNCRVTYHNKNYVSVTYSRVS